MNLLGESDDFSFKDLFLNYFSEDKKLENLITLRASYGITKPFCDFDVEQDISKSYTARIDYGFSRIKQFEELPEIFAHSSEYAYVKNISSHLKPKSISKGDLTIDAWGFGFGIKNGYGYNLNNGGKFFLNHSGTINWTRTDFEVLSLIAKNADKQLRFDEKMKFGTEYAGGIEYRIYDFWNVALDYEHSITFDNMNYGEFFSAWALDNLFQRWIDFFDPILINEFREKYPLMKWVYKNSVSLLFYNIRSKNSTFPFGNDKPLNYRTDRKSVV